MLRKKGSVHFELSTARLLDGELPITLSPSFPAIRNSFKTEAVDSAHLPFSSVSLFRPGQCKTTETRQPLGTHMTVWESLPGSKKTGADVLPQAWQMTYAFLCSARFSRRTYPLASIWLSVVWPPRSGLMLFRPFLFHSRAPWASEKFPPGKKGSFLTYPCSAMLVAF